MIAGTILRTAWREDEQEEVRGVRGFETTLLTFLASGLGTILMTGLTTPEALGSLVSANFS